MQSAETVLSAIRERGRRGLPLERLYRQLFNRELYLVAYGRHEVMVSTLAERIHDGRFLQLIKRMMQAGYLEDWIWNATLSGAPQGGTAPPILSNIYLDRLDRFVEDELPPQYNRGEVRRRNPDYLAVKSQIEKAERCGDRSAVRALEQQRRTLPGGDPNDPGFRRLRYVRYRDDFLLGFAGPGTKPNRSKRGSGGSCMTISIWTRPTPRLRSPTLPARPCGSSATRSGPGTTTPRSPAVAGRSTVSWACSCHKGRSVSGAAAT